MADDNDNLAGKSASVDNDAVEIPLSSFDLCFLLDCTGSMGSFIEACKSEIVKIASEFNNQYPNGSIRFAFVGYRDYGDDNQFEVLDFTTSVDEFKSFVRNLQATGGYDTPEDVAGGLKHCLDISWGSEVRTLFHVADAPAHGSKYWRADDHVGESGSSGGNRRRLVGSDRYQNGDPNGLDPCELLCRLRDERNVDFSFMHVIKDATEIMVSRFREAYNTENGDFVLDERELDLPDAQRNSISSSSAFRSRKHDAADESSSRAFGSSSSAPVSAQEHINNEWSSNVMTSISNSLQKRSSRR